MITSGHYTAHVQNDKKWYLFNDSIYTLKKD
jgi:ubiquitin C-terminal hydrolase